LTHNDEFQQQGLRYNEEPIVWHEKILDKYWNQLEVKMDRRRHRYLWRTDIDGIKIENIEMKKESIASLVAIFLNGSVKNSIEDVKILNANLCGEGIISLSKLIDVSYDLLTFSLNHNRIDNMEAARCLSRSLKLHSCIHTLDLVHCDLGSTPEILLVILQSDIRCINLNYNNIDSLGAIKVAEHLASDPPIEKLFLARSRLNDDDAMLISQALKWNTKLKSIYLNLNNFTSIGVKALLTCVNDSSSLNAITESNHTLSRMTIFPFHGSTQTMSMTLGTLINKLLGLDRTQKILFALSDKDFLLDYLANMPVELMPEVLAFSQRDINQCQCRTTLNIVYSTMRWWNMPLLYSHH
jgi:hypothetical protein